MKKIVFAVAFVTLILSSCNPAFTQTNVRVSKGGVSRVVESFWFDSTKIFVPVRFVSTEDSLKNNGEFTIQGDTIKWKGASGIARLKLGGGTNGQVIISDGRVFKPGSVDSVRVSHKADITGEEKALQKIWQSWAVTDSTLVKSVKQAVTIDSIEVIQAGGSSVTVNAYRNRSGTVVALLSSNYTVTTSLTTATGLQNTSFIAGDQLWISLKGLTGTITYMTLQVNYHTN